MIRQYRAADRDALYEVCLRTGASGQDATGMFTYPQLLGEVFVGPYLALQPEYAFVVDDGAGAEGYVLGALDTAAFNEQCERRWWPALRERYRTAAVADSSEDRWVLEWIQKPPSTPAFAERYPSHLHIDLLPRWQSGGWGRRMLDTLMAALHTAGSAGIHLGVSPDNTGAIGFYEHLGFTKITTDDSTIWMGRRLGERG